MDKIAETFTAPAIEIYVRIHYYTNKYGGGWIIGKNITLSFCYRLSLIELAAIIRISCVVYCSSSVLCGIVDRLKIKLARKRFLEGTLFG